MSAARDAGPVGDGTGGASAAGGPAARRERPHVLVARLDNLGDVLLTGPAVRAVAAEGRVTFLAGPGGAAAARLLPGVDDVVVFDAPWVGFEPVATDATAVADLVGRVRALHFDAAVVLTSFHQSPLPLALLLRLAGVPRIAATCEDYPGSLLDERVAYAPGGHEVDQNLAVAAALGFTLPPGDDGRLAIRRPPSPPRRRDATPGGHPYVVVHPGASVPSRALPTGLAAAAVDALHRRGWAVVVTGSAAEADVVARVAGGAPAVRQEAGTLDLAALADLLAGASALVVGNTGPAHVAAAVGTPVVGVFAPVVAPHRWRPHGVPSILLGDLDIACAGCRARSCPLPRQSCVADLRASDVLDAVEHLAGPPEPPRWHTPGPHARTSRPAGSPA
jgi:ADP-heptose:LPS heptosyltransferase